MPPIDYSKWDNIDTGSEVEESSPLPIPAPKTDSSDISQSTANVSTTTQDASDSVKAVLILCNLWRRQYPTWSPTTVPVNHDIFSNSVPSVPLHIEVPLVFYRLGTESDFRVDLDNQMITYMNIDTVSGFAPPEWANFVGNVIVARKDKKPLLPHHVEAIWMYCDYILDIFGEGEGAPTHLYNRQAFEEWWEHYCEKQKPVRQGWGGEEDPDDWKTVRSPYEF